MKKYVEPLIPGEYYHVYNRACGFEKLFLEDKNYHYFLGLMADRLGDYLELFCYCLMPNHFHLLVRMRDLIAEEDPAMKLSKEFSNFFCSYALSFNRHYNRKGSLFSQNFRRKHIKSMDYMRSAVVYIHRNPVKHGLVNDLKDWEHSSYKRILERYPKNSQVQEVIAWFGNCDIFKYCHLIEPDSDIEYK